MDTKTADHKSTLLHHMTTLWNPTPSTTQIITLLSAAANATKFCFKTALTQCDKKQEDLANINKWITGYTKNEGNRIVEVLLPFLEVTGERLTEIVKQVGDTKEKYDALSKYLTAHDLATQSSELAPILSTFKSELERCVQDLEELQRKKSLANMNGNKERKEKLARIWKGEEGSGVQGAMMDSILETLRAGY